MCRTRSTVRAYPTVRLDKKDKTYVQYHGERSIDPIITFLKDFVSKEALPSKQINTKRYV